MALIFKPLHDHLASLGILFEYMDRAWSELTQAQNSTLRPELEKKRLLMQSSSTIQGLIGFDGESPVSVVWVELPSRYYGNMLIHAIRPEYEVPTAHAIAQSGLLQGVVVELVQLVSGFEIRDALVNCGFREKERQRMLLSDVAYKPIQLPQGVTIECIKDEMSEIVGEVSSKAHSIRSQIEGYAEFKTLQARAEMSQRIRKGDYGSLLPEASILLRKDGIPVASCEVIIIECWGYPKIAWYMDVAVHPDFQGFGYGRLMMEASLNAIHEANLPAGLAVTLSNPTAKTLYQSLGFQDTEFFVEIISPDV